jgi:hypothetical protein
MHESTTTIPASALDRALRTVCAYYSLCKGCSKEILWGVDSKGTRIPLDTTPPTYVVVGNEKDGTVKIVRSSGYVSHFATCPKANEFSNTHKEQS